MRRQEPNIPDSRKQEFYSRIGTFNPELRSVGLKSLDAWMNMFHTMFPDTGLQAINEKSAQRLSAVYTCLNIRGETIGSLPFDVKQNTPQGPQTAYDHPVYRLIHDRPNPYMTAFDFWSANEKLRVGWGNAFVEIIRDEHMDPISLMIRLPWEVTIECTKETNEIYYRYKGRVIRHTEILHFKNYVIDGICGVSSIRQNALTMGMGLKLNEYNSKIIGDRPPGYLTSETRPKDLQQKKNIRDQWSKRSSADDENVDATKSKVESVGGIPYLYGGLKFVAFTLPANDVQFIESSKMTNQDIYGIFRVPPMLAQNYEKAPYNSAEQQDIVFVKYSLADIRSYEQECNEKLFPERNKTKTNNFYCKMSLNALLRGDMAARREFYSSGLNNGWLTIKDIRNFEDLPVGEGMDTNYINSTLIPANKVDAWIDSKIQKNLQPGAASGTDPQDNEDNKNRMREEILAQLRSTLKGRMNGHYAEIEGYLK